MFLLFFHFNSFMCCFIGKKKIYFLYLKHFIVCFSFILVFVPDTVIIVTLSFMKSKVFVICSFIVFITFCI
jgi:hypothetical protein